MSAADEYYLGIDGGGSRCRARIRSGAGALLSESIGGSSNMYQDFEGALQTIVATAAQAATKARLDTKALHAGVGLAGIVSADGAERIAAAELPFASLTVDNDAYAACLGAFGGGSGGIVIAGTGSNNTAESIAFTKEAAAAGIAIFATPERATIVSTPIARMPWRENNLYAVRSMRSRAAPVRARAGVRGEPTCCA